MMTPTSGLRCFLDVPIYVYYPPDTAV